jgi:hypothetical protein
VPRSPRRPEEGWLGFAARQLFLGGLGLPGSDTLPAEGWLRRAAIAFYALVTILVVAIVVLLVAQG